METWIFIFLSLSFATAVGLLLRHAATIKHKKKKRRLPPGPAAVQFLGSLLWRRPSLADFVSIIRELHARHGPILTFPIGSGPAIFISDRALAHEALVERGATFADRLPPHPALSPLTADRHRIGVAPYGPLWRLLRRNFTAGIIHPSRIKSFAPARSRVLAVLIRRLRSEASSNDSRAVLALPCFQFAVFSLLVHMCFGVKLDEGAIKDIRKAQRDFLLNSGKLKVLSYVPSVLRYMIFWKRVKTAFRLRERQKELLLPLIRARQEYHRRKQQEENGGEGDMNLQAYSYVDSLLDIELPEEGGRRLTDDEMVALCSEFLNAGTDTTTTALQWIMANLVKHPGVQSKLFEEIAAVVGDDDGGEEVLEEHLQKVPYLKAVVMEGLRRHPPGHFVPPHAVTEETVIGGYTIPTDASVVFAMAEMGWDGRVWEEPMEFRPERFLAGGAGEGVDITGTREIKMMPFGAGRRMCPAHGLAMLHLEYFVANLVRAFEWQALQGEEVDLAEKVEFTVVMKKPLRACIFPRRKTLASR